MLFRSKDRKCESASGHVSESGSPEWASRRHACGGGAAVGRFPERAACIGAGLNVKSFHTGFLRSCSFFMGKNPVFLAFDNINDRRKKSRNNRKKRHILRMFRFAAGAGKNLFLPRKASRACRSPESGETAMKGPRHRRGGNGRRSAPQIFASDRGVFFFAFFGKRACFFRNNGVCFYDSNPAEMISACRLQTSS